MNNSNQKNDIINTNNSITSYTTSSKSQRINSDSDFGINKIKSLGYQTTKIKQKSKSPLLKKNNKLKSFEIKQLEITGEDIGYINLQNNFNENTDQNDREIHINLGDNPNEEEFYRINKFENLQKSQNKNILSLSIINVNKIMDKNKNKKVNEIKYYRFFKIKKKLIYSYNLYQLFFME